MIDEVGLRRVVDKPEYYEIYALNSREAAPCHRSRLTVLPAGCSHCHSCLRCAPSLGPPHRFIADSLLNFMSGAPCDVTRSDVTVRELQPADPPPDQLRPPSAIGSLRS